MQLIFLIITIANHLFLVNGKLLTLTTKHKIPKVYILILNWNGWFDTIECLESVLRNNYSNYQVIVCDNGSSDSSFERLKAWADGKLDIYISPHNRLKDLSFPPVMKPIRYVIHDRSIDDPAQHIDLTDLKVILIQTGANLGFAGGNNIGLKYALAKDDFDYIWLINNDTVINRDALCSLVARMKERPFAGICGSSLLYYDEPETLQACGGGTYNPMTGVSRHIGALSKHNDANVSAGWAEQQCAYIVGASMLVSRQFIEKIGLLSEDYFLYFEELDWAIRAKGSFELTVAIDSIVYHKEGASLGSSHDPYQTSDTSDYFSVVNRLKITSKYYPMYLVLVWLSLMVVLWNRLKRWQLLRVWMVIKIFFGWRARRT